MKKLSTMLQKEIENKKSSISEQELYCSFYYKRYLTNIAETITKRYGRALNIFLDWNTKPNAVAACTNDKTIYINCANKITASFPTRQLKSDSLVGFLGHEAAHILFTDFLASEKHIAEIKQGNFCPDFPQEQYQQEREEIKKILTTEDKGFVGSFVRIVHMLHNILEDAYVEAKMCEKFPGSIAECIQLNNMRIAEYIPSIRKQIEYGYAKFSIICNLLTQYYKGETTNVLGECEKEYLDVLQECIPFIEHITTMYSEKDRFNVACKITTILWKYIKEVLKEYQEEENIEEKIKNNMKEQVVGTEIPVGDTASIELTEEVVSNAISFNAEKEINAIVEQIAEKAVLQEQEEMRLYILQNTASSLCYGDIHKDVSLLIHRELEVDAAMKEKYERISAPLVFTAKRMAKQLENAIQKRQKAIKLSQYHSGKKINMKSVIAEEAAIFYKTMPYYHKSMAVAVLCDQSGSMKGSRITAARDTSIILYHFCRMLKIPVMIAGHHEMYEDVIIHSYVEFEELDKEDAFRLVSMQSYGCNRDGMAIRYAVERLLERKEDTKLFILISDGRPSAKGYSGKEAELDLRQIKKEYTNKGILFFTAAIGEDKEQIQKIYGDGYLDVTQLDQLPLYMTRLIQKYI